MSKEEAKAQLKGFFEGIPMLTFSIKEFPNGEWTAQCNEIDGIITGGTGNNMSEMEALMQDAILTAAGIPAEHVEGLLKRVWDPSYEATPNTQINISTSARLFSSFYQIDAPYAGVGQL